MKIKSFLLPFILVACGPYNGDIKPVNNGPMPVRDTNWCEAAEVNLERLKCEDRAGNPMWVNKLGERFKDICERVQKKGGIFLNPKCMATAENCGLVKQCPLSED